MVCGNFRQLNEIISGIYRDIGYHELQSQWYGVQQFWIMVSDNIIHKNSMNNKMAYVPILGVNADGRQREYS